MTSTGKATRNSVGSVGAKSQEEPDVVRAKRFEIVDDDGRLRAVIGPELVAWTLSPRLLVVAPIKLTTTSWLVRGRPRQFIDTALQSLCSMLIYTPRGEALCCGGFHVVDMSPTWVDVHQWAEGSVRCCRNFAGECLSELSVFGLQLGVSSSKGVELLSEGVVAGPFGRGPGRAAAGRCGAV